MVTYQWVRFQHFMEAFLKLFYKKRGKLLTLPQIEKRLAICYTCDQFNGARCTLCECCINDTESLFNKVAYPTERCPYNPPKWLEVNDENVSADPDPVSVPDAGTGPVELSKGSEGLVQEP